MVANPMSSQPPKISSPWGDGGMTGSFGPVTSLADRTAPRNWMVPLWIAIAVTNRWISWRKSFPSSIRTVKTLPTFPSEYCMGSINSSDMWHREVLVLTEDAAGRSALDHTRIRGA